MSINATQTEAIMQLRQEAQRLQLEFEDYLDDLRLFSNPEFWAAIKESQKGNLKKYTNIEEMLADLKK